MQKRVLAIHDISCVGKCSLTVALPIISAAGIETSVLPTAVLSTHTGGFTGFTFRDLTNDIKPIVDHWKTLNLNIDGIYTGYLGSFEQLDLVSNIFDELSNRNTLKIVDPVMADNGKLYSSFDKEFPKGMKKLCSKANIIIPNITEACLMLDIEYKEGPYTEFYIENILSKLALLGPDRIVLTGVSFDEEYIGAATYDNGRISYYFAKKIPGYYHGTGDVFGSALVGAILNNKSLPEAAEIAVDFVVESINLTYNAKTDIKYGVNFEACLANFIDKVK